MLDYIVKIFVSGLLSSFIGLEREKSDKPAGLRDVMLISLSGTLFTIISQLLAAHVLPGTRYDIGRIIAYSIAGIGFLGSGVIIQHRGNVEGITTAALLWSVIGLGILVGLGEFQLAVVAALFIYFVLKLKEIRIKIEKRICNNGAK